MKYEVVKYIGRVRVEKIRTRWLLVALYKLLASKAGRTKLVVVKD